MKELRVIKETKLGKSGFKKVSCVTVDAIHSWDVYVVSWVIADCMVPEEMVFTQRGKAYQLYDTLKLTR